jgi:Bacterial-like globin
VRAGCHGCAPPFGKLSSVRDSAGGVGVSLKLRCARPSLACSPLSSLYDWAGGEAAFARLINAFYDRVEADDLLSGLFPGGVSEEHRLHVIAWWSEVFGGPTRYTYGLIWRGVCQGAAVTVPCSWLGVGMVGGGSRGATS